MCFPDNLFFLLIQSSVMLMKVVNSIYYLVFFHWKSKTLIQSQLTHVVKNIYAISIQYRTPPKWFIKKSHCSGKFFTAFAKPAAFDLSAYLYFISMPNYIVSVISSSFSFRKHMEYEKNWHIIENYLKEKGQKSKKKMRWPGASLSVTVSSWDAQQPSDAGGLVLVPQALPRVCQGSFPKLASWLALPKQILKWRLQHHLPLGKAFWMPMTHHTPANTHPSTLEHRWVLERGP